jgi:hypothetical protein
MLNRKAREAANGWLSRLAPLLEEFPPSQAEQCRTELEALETLRLDGEQVLATLQQHALAPDATLLETLRQALEELDGIESHLRRQLSALAPGDPDGEVNLEVMRAKLAEVAARREVAGVAGPLCIPGSASVEPFTLLGSEPDSSNALFLGGWALIGLAIVIYRVVEIFLTKGFRPDMLLVYIACGVGGLSMLYSAIRQGSREEVTLDGLEMKIRSRLGPFHWSSQHRLEAGSRVRRMRNGYLTIQNSDGKSVRFGERRPRSEQFWLRNKINGYLDSLA